MWTLWFHLNCTILCKLVTMYWCAYIQYVHLACVMWLHRIDLSRRNVELFECSNAIERKATYKIVHKAASKNLNDFWRFFVDHFKCCSPFNSVSALSRGKNIDKMVTPQFPWVRERFFKFSPHSNCFAEYFTVGVHKCKAFMLPYQNISLSHINRRRDRL